MFSTLPWLCSDPRTSPISIRCDRCGRIVGLKLPEVAKLTFRSQEERAHLLSTLMLSMIGLES